VAGAWPNITIAPKEPNPKINMPLNFMKTLLADSELEH
jgi:hypothetical protein